MQRFPNAGTSNHKILGDSLTMPFSGKVAKTRFMKAAMTERQSSWDQHDVEKRGTPSDGLIRVYGEWAKGDFGIILTGNTMMHYNQLEAPGNPIIYKPHMTPERREAFRRQAEASKSDGSLIIMQLSHPGRQVAEAVNPDPVSASDVKLDDRMGMTFAKPHSASQAEIDEIIEEFVYASQVAHETGYDGVELHAAHGYLLAQFLSQTTNKRTDKYGGSVTNRGRLIIEIIDAIKKNVNDSTFSIGIKLNSVEFQQGGFQPEEAKELCVEMEEHGLDFVELSGGTYQALAFNKRESTKDREAFFLEFADIVRPALKKTVLYVTGGFRTSAAMVKAIEDGSTQGIGLARPICTEPYLPRSLIRGDVDSAVKPILDESDFGITNAAAGVSMTQMARNQTPFDTSDAEQVKAFQAAMGTFMQQTQDNAKAGVLEAGFPSWTYPYQVSQ